MKCLVVEDDDLLVSVLHDHLEDLRHQVTIASTIKDAMRCMRTDHYDLLLIDFHLPDGDTVSVSEYAGMFQPGIMTILLTGTSAFPNGEHKVLAPCIDWVLRKPVRLEDLSALVSYVEEQNTSIRVPHGVI